MNKLYVITFSPTGGTQRVAECIASGISDDFIRIDLCEKQFDAASLCLCAEDLCIIAVPSFAGRVPPTAAERIQLIAGSGAMSVAVAVYGNRAYEDTLIEMKDLLTGCGFRTIAAIAAIAEHSMLRNYASGRPDAADRAQLSEFGKRIAAAAKSCSVSSDLSVPGNTPYRPIGAFLKPIVNENCIACGVCADMCPVGAIPADTPSSTDTDACISCVRCVSVCPVQARILDPNTLAAVEQRIGPALSGRKENELFI